MPHLLLTITKSITNNYEIIWRKMPSADQVSLTGTVTKVLPGTTFEVTIANGQTVLAYLGGRLRKNKIRILLGDTVSLELSPYDLQRARISYRH